MTPRLWSVNALSVELGLDRRSLARRLEGLEPAEQKIVGRRTERLYRMRNVFGHLMTADGERLDVNAERVKLARCQREKIEFELAAKRRRVISVEAVLKHWQYMFYNVRARLLAIPNKAAQRVAHVDERVAFVILEDLIYEALHEMAGSPVPPDLRARIDGCGAEKPAQPKSCSQKSKEKA